MTYDMYKAVIELQRFRCIELVTPPVQTLGLSVELMMKFQNLHGLSTSETVLLVGHWYDRFIDDQRIPGVEGVL